MYLSTHCSSLFPQQFFVCPFMCLSRYGPSICPLLFLSRNRMYSSENRVYLFGIRMYLSENCELLSGNREYLFGKYKPSLRTSSWSLSASPLCCLCMARLEFSFYKTPQGTSLNIKCTAGSSYTQDDYKNEEKEENFFSDNPQW